MSIDWDTPVSELMHGDNIRYIDLDEDEILHWKYIKREKLSNGKYRYYYVQSELDRTKAEADEKSSQAFKDSAEMYTRENIYKKAAKEAQRAGGLTPELFEASRKYEAAKYRYEVSYRAAQDAIKKYNKVKVSTFAERTISKGIVKIANLISGLFSKKK